MATLLEVANFALDRGNVLVVFGDRSAQPFYSISVGTVTDFFAGLQTLTERQLTARIIRISALRCHFVLQNLTANIVALLLRGGIDARKISGTRLIGGTILVYTAGPVG